MAPRRTEKGGGAKDHPGDTSYTSGGRNNPRGSPDNLSQQYPATVVLDPNTSSPQEFQRMNTLVGNGIYTVIQDRAGRSVFQLTSLGSAHNVRATGTGRTDVTGWTGDESNQQANIFTQGYKAGQTSGDHSYGSMGEGELKRKAYEGNTLAQRELDRREKLTTQTQLGAQHAATTDYSHLFQPTQEQLTKAYNEKVGFGRGTVVEQPGARADVYEYGQTTEAPTTTPEGTKITYKAGDPHHVATKAHAEQLVAAGVVAVGATFVLPDGTTGRAQ